MTFFLKINEPFIGGGQQREKPSGEAPSGASHAFPVDFGARHHHNNKLAEKLQIHCM